MPNRLSLTRRGLLAAGGAALIGAASGCTAAGSVTESTASAAPHASGGPTPAAAATGASAVTHPFYGEHQPGVETPPALLQTFIGLDLVDPTASNADAVLRLVSDDAARLMAGEPALGDTEAELAEHPAGLTISVGLGRPLFTRTGRAECHPRSADRDPRLPHGQAGGRLVADGPAAAGRQ